jgi:cytochrome c oxidase subunit 2
MSCPGSFGSWGQRALPVALVCLLVLVDPVAASPTTTADYINELRYKLLVIAIPVTIVTEAALYYALEEFRDNDEASPTKENRPLEVTWTATTAVILLFVGAASYGVMAQPSVGYQPDQPQPEGDDVVVAVEAYQWGWVFNYPQHENVSTSRKIVLPVDTTVYFSVTSRDVVHSFSVPAMGVKQDAFPGAENVVMTTTTEQGTFQGYCTEFCGVNHAGMTFEVAVMGESEFQGWLDEQERRPGDDGGNESES